MFFYRDHKGETLLGKSSHAADEFIKRNPIGEVIVRLDKDKAEPDVGFFDLRIPDWTRGTTCWTRFLPTRGHTMTVQLRQDDGKYDQLKVNVIAEGCERSRLARAHSGKRRSATTTTNSTSSRKGSSSPGPRDSELGRPEDINFWWEDKDRGIRAVAVNTQDLIVDDLKAVDSVPTYQPTKSWTRGVSSS